MKFGLSIPDSWRPKSWRSDVKAFEDFKKKLAQNKKRVSHSLTVRRQFVASMQQDELKLAIMWAAGAIGSVTQKNLGCRWLQ